MKSNNKKKNESTLSRAGARKNEREIMVHVATNDPTHVGRLADIFEMVYRGCDTNTLGVMEALNSETGKEEILLVGLEPQPDGTCNTYPLAKLLDLDEILKYRSPNGRGEWMGGPENLNPETYDNTNLIPNGQASNDQPAA